MTYTARRLRTGLATAALIVAAFLFGLLAPPHEGNPMAPTMAHAASPITGRILMPCTDRQARRWPVVKVRVSAGTGRVTEVHQKPRGKRAGQRCYVVTNP